MTLHLGHRSLKVRSVAFFPNYPCVDRKMAEELQKQTTRSRSSKLHWHADHVWQYIQYFTWPSPQGNVQIDNFDCYNKSIIRVSAWHDKTKATPNLHHTMVLLEAFGLRWLEIFGTAVHTTDQQVFPSANLGIHNVMLPARCERLPPNHVDLNWSTLSRTKVITL